MSSTEREVRFTDFDAPFEPSYRPLSRGAVVSVGATIVAFFSLLTPVLWCLPLLSAVVAALALGRIDRSELKMTGRWLAWTMFLISVILLGFAPARHLTANAFASNQAIKYADAWLELFKAGKYHEAHQLTRSVQDRQPPDTDLDEYYRQKLTPEGAERRMMMEVADPTNDINMFLNADPIKELRAAGPNLTWDYQSASVVHRTQVNPITLVDLRYNVALPFEKGVKTFAIVIALERTVDHTSRQAHWRLKTVTRP